VLDLWGKRAGAVGPEGRYQSARISSVSHIPFPPRHEKGSEMRRRLSGRRLQNRGQSHLANRWRSVLLTVISMAVAGILSACSSSSTPSSTGAPSSAPPSTNAASTPASVTTNFEADAAPYLAEPASLPNYPALSRRPPTGEQIYFISDGSEVDEAQAAAAACKTLGWNYHAITYATANPAAANSAILSAINAGATGIIALAVTPSAVQPALAPAKSRNIPMVIIAANVPTNAPGYSQVSNVNADNTVGAKVLAYAVLADAQQQHLTAHIALVSSSSIPAFAAVNTAETQAIKDACAACSVTLVNVPLQQLVQGNASAATISFLQTNSATNYVLVNAFPGSMASALRNAGFSKVRIGIFGGIAGDNAAVKAGSYIFNINISNKYNSWLAVDSIARALTGGDTGIHNAEATPFWIVTPHNINFNTAVLPDFPLNYAQDFAKLWHVS
jgi:ABC-type sugar transport system substrate-binding protein